VRVAWIAAAVYIALQTALVAYRWHILTITSDPGLFAQAILNAGHGFWDTPEGGSHFKYHFSPILAMLYPAVALTRSALALQLVGIVLIGLCAPALALLFQPYLSALLLGRLAVIALLYAPLGSVGFAEFHELAFFPITAILLLWAADRERWGLFALLGLAAISIREDVGIELSIIGLGIAAFTWLRRRGSTCRGLLLGEPRNPVATTWAFGILGVFSAAVVTVYFRMVAAVFSSWQPSADYDYPMSSGPSGLVTAILTKPLVAIPALFNFGKLTYVLEGVLPLVLLPLRSLWSLLALPALLILLLASNSAMWNMGRHYSAMWAPWLLIGTGVALVHIERVRGSTSAATWANAAIAGCLIVLLAFNPMHPGVTLRPAYHDVGSARAALACVPRGASIDTHEEWFAQIAADNVRSTHSRPGTTDYLVYATDYHDDAWPLTAPHVAAQVRAGNYAPVCRFGNVVTYRRSVTQGRSR
jgi:uncharacterized membrane protein